MKLLTLFQSSQVVAVAVVLHLQYQQVAAVILLCVLSASQPLVMAVTTVQIGDRVLTISGDQGTEDLVFTAGDVVNKYFNVASEKADVVEAVLPAAPTAEEKEENRVLASALGNNDGDVAEEEMETGTEAALPTPASSEAIGEVAETMTEAENRSSLALATAKTEENSAQVQEVPALPGQ